VGPRRDLRAPKRFPAPPPSHVGGDVCCPHRKWSPGEEGSLRTNGIGACQRRRPWPERFAKFLIARERTYLPDHTRGG
jgi:hypothetical protein